MKLFGSGPRVRSTRQWTLLVLSEHENRARQYSLTERRLHRGLAGGVLIVLAISFVLAGFFREAGNDVRLRRLARENELLTEQVSRHRDALGQLQGTLSVLQKHDEAFRLIAGLDPLTPSIYGAGIGGPQSPGSFDRYAPLDPALRKAITANALDLEAITRRVQVLRASWGEAVESLRRKQEELAATPSILPTVGYMSSAFTHSRWHPILDEDRPHAGIDIAAPTGTPILAAARGRVAFVGNRGQYGLMVELDHGHGYVTRYAHMASAAVRVGQIVPRRARIGAVGETGLAIGPHLHYEVLLNGVARNPIGYIFDAQAIPD